MKAPAKWTYFCYRPSHLGADIIHPPSHLLPLIIRVAWCATLITLLAEISLSKAHSPDQSCSFDFLSDSLTFAEMCQCIWVQKQEGRKHMKFLLPFISSVFVVRKDFYYLGLSFVLLYFLLIFLSFTLILLKLPISFLSPSSRVLSKSPWCECYVKYPLAYPLVALNCIPVTSRFTQLKLETQF